MRSRILTGIIAVLSIFGSAQGAPTTAPSTSRSIVPTVGPPTEKIKKLAGKTIYFMEPVDVLGAGEPNTLETSYLEAVLVQHGISTPRWVGIDPLKSGDILVISAPPVPAFTFDELQNPLNQFKSDRAKAALREYEDGGRAKLLAAAKSKGVVIVESEDAHTYFGFDRQSTGLVKRFGFQLKALALERPLPEIKFDGNFFTDVFDFLRDVTDENIFVDWDALSKAGVERDKEIKLHLQNVPFKEVLEAVLQQAGGTKLKAYFDGSTLLITTADMGAKMRARKGSTWLTFSELGDPPAAVLQPQPEISPPLARMLPELRFNQNSLSDVVDFLKDVSGQKFEVDWTALKTIKIGKESPVSISARRVPLHRMLAYVSASVSEDAVFYVSNTGVIHLTTRTTAEKAKDKLLIFEP